MKTSNTTSFDESKYEVIGIVDSVITRSISSFRQSFAQFIGIFGGQNDVLNEKFLDAHNAVIQQLQKKAERMGADMLIGVSVSTTMVNMRDMEFFTFSGLGTALRLKQGAPAEGGRRRRTLRRQ
jgi:uncharacterized protein YbjQ (UPF0145 family)